ncbi:MAG: hypothetical protein JWQ09_310 [Segetibacter sp.]|nr:hypothetical protein [Segetibacter sp.]
MDLSLKNYKTTLPKELQKLAEKNEVRECDETEKGHYVAYVDEGNDTFDVSLALSSDQTVSSHSCDCKNSSGFCRHKTALLMHIAKGTKITHSVKAKKKSKTEALLEDAELNDLKEWVRDLLQKNKDLELSFTHYFSGKQQQYSPDEVTKLTNDAVKAVVKNKKNLDPTQLKKVVDLWSDIHAPIVKSYHANVANESFFMNFHTLLESCLLFQANINTSSTRITKYIEGLLQQSVEPVNNLYNEDLWKTAVGYFTQQINDKHKIRMHYVFHLKNILSISSEERRNALIDLLATLYKKRFSENISNGNQYTKALFEIMEEYGLIHKYYKLFQPITFDNDFNVKLIRTLIDNNEPKDAEEYCKKQIQDNYKDEYNVPYLELLKEIYTVEKDEVNLAQVLSQLFPTTYNFDDFLYIYDRMKDAEEKKKWRTKILSRAKNASNNYNKSATGFIFKLMDYEKKYLKMIGYINSQTPYHVILEYFEPMALTDKTSLLKALIDKRESYFRSGFEDAEKDQAIFPQLLARLLRYYKAEYLVRAVNEIAKEKYYYTPNSFIQYLQKKIV